MDPVWEFYFSEALFGCYNTQNYRVLSCTRKSLPMGVKCWVHYLVFTTKSGVKKLLFFMTFNIRRAISAPDGSSPKAIVEFLYSSIASKILSCFDKVIPTQTILPYIFFIGCAFSAPDGSSPWGNNWVLAADYRLITLFLRLVELLVIPSQNFMTSLLSKLTNFTGSSHLEITWRVNCKLSWPTRVTLQRLIWPCTDRAHGGGALKSQFSARKWDATSALRTMSRPMTSSGLSYFRVKPFSPSDACKIHAWTL
jgi:hypothetical protein